MRKWILLAVASVFGVVLAFVLLAGVDTGDDVTDHERVEVAPKPVAAAGDTPKPAMLGRPGRDGEAPKMREAPANGVNPIAAEGKERRAQPDAVTAGRASAPWSLVRRTILQNEDAFSKEVLEESGKIIADLRQARRDPDAVDFEALEARQMDLAKRVRESDLGVNPTVTGALDRLDTIYQEYHEEIGQ